MLFFQVGLIAINVIGTDLNDDVRFIKIMLDKERLTNDVLFF